ncbi:ComEC/Rec2 family competence protein [Thermoanaerobacter wiegelii]|uniref:Beta-lactamase domain-containing protein n=1 Tax=Thermoanaerobacter wiegelii Rt8.B1 TaxID=697303 RepID=G2MTV4_9THEO|nr:MBL fold metallo-hydrolase [Thermoanaerobacter wiegelii]AEM79489.1 beta-lactamase domain-containing protein [Thermoanaerobacter wiegelii Rt8.B1]
MKKRLLSLLLIFILLLFSFAGCSGTTNIDQQSTSIQTQQVNAVQTQQTNTQETNQAAQQQSNKSTNTSVSGKLTASFIGMGQGDSIFIQTPSGKTMLIDAGVPEMGSRVVDFIKSRGINKIDILVGTHPHADHIGGIPAVIENFQIGKFYMPKVTTTTKTFEDVLRAAKAKGLSINIAKAGVAFDLGSDVTAKMIAPNNTSYDDLNNYSAVIKLTYGNTSFLFTGDASAQSEEEMLSKGYDLKADVLKVGHHGSSSATTWVFLKAVSPKYAVISVGKNNDYGHPHKETMEKLKSLGVTVYRTDECGTVVAVSDGRTISFNVKPGDYTAGSSGNSSTSSTSSSKTFQSLPYICRQQR